MENARTVASTNAQNQDSCRAERTEQKKDPRRDLINELHIVLNSPAAADQLKYQNYDRHDQQDVDEAAEGLSGDTESQGP